MRYLAWRLGSLLCILACVFSLSASAQEAPQIPEQAIVPSAAPAPSAPAPAVVPLATPFFDPESTEARSRAALMRELLQTESAVRSLREERPSLVLPIVLLAAGGGVSVLTSLAGLLWWSDHEQQRYGFRDNGDRYEYKDPKAHSAVIKISAYAAVGGVLLLSGAVLLATRLRTRRALSREAAPYKQRRRELQEQLRAGVKLGPGTVVGTARITF